MNAPRMNVDPDIGRARTLPGSIYSDPKEFDLQRERIFARAWHWIPEGVELGGPDFAVPFTILPGFLDEELLLTRSNGNVHCLSNVCTHRGTLVVETPGVRKHLRCRYHGRRFQMDGQFVSMPEFQGVEGFPSESDNLPRVAHETWGPLHFASLDPAFSFEETFGPIRERMSFLPVEQMKREPKDARNFEVASHWALYCENYLEGFHIPFVHPDLRKALDVKSYRTELFGLATLQIGVAAPGESCFELPSGHPDAGQRIAAYYFWIFPNLMLNFYPWGLSINLVRPLAVDRCRVTFDSYVLDPSKRTMGAGANLDKVELEDEEVVQLVQKGIRSRLYTSGRYSPTQERGVHHFHRLLARALA